MKEIGKNKLLNLKQIGMTVNSVRHSIKLNKEKQKENIEFENELYKTLIIYSFSIKIPLSTSIF